MPPQITAFFQRFGAGLKSFTAGQRTIAVIGAALLVVGIVALSAWLTRPVLTPLFSGLQTTDANGNVKYPDIDMAEQMGALIIAQRGYQANAQVVDRARETYMAALEIGRS